MSLLQLFSAVLCISRSLIDICLPVLNSSRTTATRANATQYNRTPEKCRLGQWPPGQMAPTIGHTEISTCIAIKTIRISQGAASMPQILKSQMCVTKGSLSSDHYPEPGTRLFVLAVSV